VNNKKASAIFLFFLFSVACGRQPEQNSSAGPAAVSSRPEFTQATAPTTSPAVPNLQAEILDDRFKTTNSPIGKFDFRNFTYPLPRGWQNPDGSDLTLVDGHVGPVRKDTDEDMSPDEKAELRAGRRIGMSYVTTKFLDVTGDGTDEAAVILKVETAGSAIPQIVYLFEWKDGAPALLQHFRTGDRADGGLKDIRVEGGELVLELYGQDRFLLGETETGKITGDEEQLCCPTFFTRTRYKWNGRDLLLQGKRLTYSISDPATPPLENFGDIMNDPIKSKKYLDAQKPAR
jgi:hypothetical protein